MCYVLHQKSTDLVEREVQDSCHVGLSTLMEPARERVCKQKGKNDYM